MAILPLRLCDHVAPLYSHYKTWHNQKFLPFVKDVRQGNSFQKCTHLLYCSVLSLGAYVNTRRMSKPDMGSIIHIKNQWNILVIGNHYVNYQNYQNLMLLTSSDTKRTLMHLLLFTNSAQRELVSIWTQSIHNRNWLSLPYILTLRELAIQVTDLTFLFIKILARF